MIRTGSVWYRRHSIMPYPCDFSDNVWGPRFQTKEVRVKEVDHGNSTITVECRTRVRGHRSKWGAWK